MTNQKQQTFSAFLLFITAFLWGVAFVAQKDAMDYLHPLTFNGIRFLLGGLLVYGFSLYSDYAAKKRGEKVQPYFSNGKLDKKLLIAGFSPGFMLFIASTFLQIGIVDSTAGKSAFISALYMLIVPIASLLLGKKISKSIWIALPIAIIGLYLLCIKPGEISFSKGDLIILCGSFFWAAQIMLAGKYASQVNVLKMASIQFLSCGILSGIAAIFLETVTLPQIQDAAIPILYSGFLSIGIAFTLQIYGQKHTSSVVASIIMSLESVFAVLAGFFLLQELLTIRELIGCILMFSGVIIAQIPQKGKVDINAGTD